MDNKFHSRSSTVSFLCEIFRNSLKYLPATRNFLSHFKETSLHEYYPLSRGPGKHFTLLRMKYTFIISIIHKYNLKKYCTQGNICPHVLFAPFTIVVSGRIQDWANSILANNISSNLFAYGRISDGTKTVCKCRRAKKYGAKITLYTVS